MRLHYRADIDGLRAISIIAVVLFHANFRFFGGGFVGVDVFFVISGFLITGIILKNAQSSLGFLKSFYEGRIRRLLPPAIPVLISTAALGFWLLPAEEMEELSKSLLFFISFSSNWFFLKISGYFDGPAHLKPLLHTWSLSVEEQFYLFFPAATLWLANKGRRSLLCFLSIITISSFLINIYLILSHDTDSAFFNSLGRFWEMGIGALLACGVMPPAKSVRIRHMVGSGGLLIILACFTAFTPDIDFPGFWALLPTIGAAMVIYAQGSIASRILSLKPFVWVGLISYALYLWHWPLFVYLRFYFVHPTQLQFVIAIAAAAVLSVASYLCIERPIRSKKALTTRRKVLSGYIMSMVFMVAVGLGGYVTHGYPERLPQEAVRYVAHKKEQIAEQRKAALYGKCWVNGGGDIDRALPECIKDDGRLKMLVVGDSHAAQFYAPLKMAFPQYNVSLLASNSCSLSGLDRDYERTGCAGLMKYLDGLSKNDFSIIIMTTREPIRGANFRNFMERAAKASEISTVYILGPIPFYNPNMPEIFERDIGRKVAASIEADFDEALDSEQFETDSFFKQAIKLYPEVKYISLLDEMCRNRKCRHYDGDGWPVLIDNTHMSLEAATEVIDGIRDKIIPAQP